MSDSESIEALDVNGERIVPGTVLRYVNTDTLGRALEIKEDDEGIWVLFDTTGLYYNVEALVITDPSALKEKVEEEKGKFDAKEYVKRFEQQETADIGQVTGGG